LDKVAATSLPLSNRLSVAGKHTFFEKNTSTEYLRRFFFQLFGKADNSRPTAIHQHGAGTNYAG
jgi:hypothetical protein